MYELDMCTRHGVNTMLSKIHANKLVFHQNCKKPKQEHHVINHEMDHL